ncbi:hypothetical protein CKO_03763 [Citrobacter koseri ATCC BAA-895]|uniref:Uncharacterized protein n=1 Tax=Citrobacter koseri (strain ATCC BAA-895 / CDC 4225-83 / SGSC4696) TaxID=290338 RepID=A8AMX5_CITK8|nr:hypothetical protein CKO_03763 [Citrobacter koseri ATCC BAA-895]
MPKKAAIIHKILNVVGTTRNLRIRQPVAEGCRQGKKNVMTIFLREIATFYYLR